MLISWNWLKQYVDLDVSVDELTHRLTMSGLNLESTSDSSGDLVIDLEVTSNRPDCLGHVGVAREVAAARRYGDALKAATELRSSPVVVALRGALDLGEIAKKSILGRVAVGGHRRRTVDDENDSARGVGNVHGAGLLGVRERDGTPAGW